MYRRQHRHNAIGCNTCYPISDRPRVSDGTYGHYVVLQHVCNRLRNSASKVTMDVPTGLDTQNVEPGCLYR